MSECRCRCPYHREGEVCCVDRNRAKLRPARSRPITLDDLGDTYGTPAAVLPGGMYHGLYRAQLQYHQQTVAA